MAQQLEKRDLHKPAPNPVKPRPKVPDKDHMYPNTTRDTMATTPKCPMKRKEFDIAKEKIQKAFSVPPRPGNPAPRVRKNPSWPRMGSTNPDEDDGTKKLSELNIICANHHHRLAPKEKLHIHASIVLETIVMNKKVELNEGEVFYTGDEWPCWIEEESHPIRLLMRQIEDSVEMPLLDFDPEPSNELVQLLSLYCEDMDKARIHFILEWNLKVNTLLESSGISNPSIVDRNVVSLILSKLNSNMPAAWKCLTNENARKTIETCKKRLEEECNGEKIHSLHRNNGARNFVPSMIQSKGLGIDEEKWKEAVANVIVESLQITEQKCQICWDHFEPSEIFGSSCCQCIVCNPCMQKYFVVMIHDGYVSNFVCPVCHHPDIDDGTLHFQLLEPKLKFLLSKEDFTAYQRKMTEWNLMKNSNFRWCISATCHFGFLVPDDVSHRAVCPECKTEMCHQCKKPWEKQHEGLTCEKFQEWKQRNDPLFQEEGLVRQLQENGIDCPRCHRYYLVSKGGCLHFTCTFCDYEFCSSCSRPFLRSCKVRQCRQSGGLHCHHPRNCLYYLRDRTVTDLQKLLKNNGSTFDVNSSNVLDFCPVLEEKDAKEGLIHEACKKSVISGHAGLCETHYKEYLIGIIQKDGIDPACIMTEAELLRVLENAEVKDMPKEKSFLSPEKLRCHLAQMVMAEVALPKYKYL